MSSPRRFTNGVTNVKNGTTLGAFVDTDPTKVITFFDDFQKYRAADWVVTAVNSSTVAMSDTYVGGAVVLTADTAENDGVQLQASHDDGTNDSEVFRIQAGKKAWFKCKFQGADVDQTDFVCGIAIADTSLIASAPTDGAYFISVDGSATVNFYSTKDSVASSVTNIGTLVDATDATVGFYWDGVDTYSLYFNDVLAGTLQGGSIPDDEYMAVSFGMLTGEGVANTMTVDYIFAATER